MTLLIVSVAVVLLVSALCSLTEAAIYAVRMPLVRALSESGSRSGRKLAHFKDNMERPIAAILIINTVANTAGASIAGSQARDVFGEQWMVGFSLAMTAGVLFLSEIVPKILGVVYSDRIAVVAAIPLHLAIRALYPLIWIVERISRRLKPSGPVIAAPEEEVAQLAQISAEEGSILPIEAELVRNVLKVDRIHAGEIMTPRDRVSTLPAGMKLRDAAARVIDCPHSRIPVYEDGHPDNWIGVVLQRQILSALAQDQFDRTIGELATPLYFVTESAAGHALLREFIRKHTHLFGVVNEFGVILGVVTLEDVIESLIGQEIYDEVDVAVDMHEIARCRAGFGQGMLSQAPTESSSQANTERKDDA